MTIALRFARDAILLVALAAGSAFNVAQANHYILPCAPDCRDGVDVPVGPWATGSWFNAGLAGQGFSIQVLPGQPLQLMASWFVFAPEGGQAWIVGQGAITGTKAVLQAYRMTGEGARFPPAFDQANVRPEHWGTLTFTFSDCDRGRVAWASSIPGYGNGRLNLERLTQPAGLTCSGGDAADALR